MYCTLWIWFLPHLVVSLAKTFLKISLPAYLNSRHLETKQNMLQQRLKQRVSFKRKSNPFELRHIKLPYAYIFCRTRNLPCFLFSRAFPVWVLPHHKYFFHKCSYWKEAGILNNPQVTCIHKLKFGIKMRIVIVWLQSNLQAVRAPQNWDKGTFSYTRF